MSATTPLLNSHFWQETAHADDPFAAERALCSGYDVYGDLLGKASYPQFLYLLFQGERPAAHQARALELLTVALANPGPRDPSVHAAMCGGVGGSTSASMLIAALAAGAGSYGGAREVLLMAQQWQQRGTDLAIWRQLLSAPPPPTRDEVWPPCEHPPGFAPYDKQCRLPVLQTLEHLSTVLPSGQLAWLQANRAALEQAAGHPLALTGVAAACLTELGFAPETAEMLTLMLRLPGAAAHALEQNRLGFRQFPYFSMQLSNDPGPSPTPATPTVPKEQA